MRVTNWQMLNRIQRKVDIPSEQNNREGTKYKMLSIIQMVGYGRFNYPAMLFPTIVDNDNADDNHDDEYY